jgi:DNA-binding GntR family transcriptional regulator
MGLRSRRVHTALRACILSRELPPGHKLPAHTQLAAEYGIAGLTMRHVLASTKTRGWFRASKAAARSSGSGWARAC